MRTANLWTAAFLAALGILHLLLPDLAWRWRARGPLGETTRSLIRSLGMGLLGLAALLVVVTLALFR